MGPMIQQVQQPCNACGATGEYIAPSDKCGTCGGQKVVSEKATVRMPIEPGAENGQQFLLQGEGHQSVSPSVYTKNVLMDQYISHGDHVEMWL